MTIDREFWRKVESRRFRIKDSDQFKTLDDVFDQATLRTLYELMSRGIVGEIHGPVAQGKEAKVFWAETPDGKDIAVKVFYTSTVQFIRGRYKYIVEDPRFQGLKASSIRRLVEAWCRKEFRNLKLARKAGVQAPEPIAFRRNILVMEFIAYRGQRGVPAPLIKDEPPDDPERAYLTILSYIERGFVLGSIVHADLSEYNIVNTGDRLVVIDWGSAVSANHPEAVELLRRDVSNVNRYFSQELDVKVHDVDSIVNALLKRRERFRKLSDEEVAHDENGFLLIDGKTLLDEIERSS